MTWMVFSRATEKNPYHDLSKFRFYTDAVERIIYSFQIYQFCRL